MYIEKIVIEGFKTYQGPITIGPFDSEYNVIVGRNGSGKSNFYEAIQFVLSEEYRKLSSRDYSDFLHEGTVCQSPSAFVEIIFNNFDKQVDSKTPQISIRREISRPHKDQFYLNKKKVSYSDIRDFLHSAGISNCNPYFIIKQRKLLETISTKDYERLAQLEEIAGVTVFDNNYEKIHGLLEKIVYQLEHDDMSADLNNTLRQKEKDQQDLQYYVNCDKERRMVEYLLNELEAKKFTNLYKKVKIQYSKRSEEWITAQQELKAAEEEFFKWENDLNESNKNLQNLQLRDRQLITKREQLLIKLENWNYNVELLVNTIRKDKDAQVLIQGQLEVLNESITKHKEDLIPIKEEYEAAKKEEETTLRDLTLKEQQQTEMNLKNQRKRDFASKEERDDWIRNKLELLNKDIEALNQSEVELKEEIEAEKDKKGDMEKEILELKKTWTSLMKEIEDYEGKLVEEENKKVQYQRERKILFKNKMICENELRDLQSELKKAEKAYGVNKNIIIGLESVAKVLEILRQDPNNDVDGNYFGTVIENFNPIDQLITAVEAVAGNRLLNHIVKTDEFGRKILEEMNKNDLPGEVTFLPLNRLPERKTRNYPQEVDGRPLIFYDLHYNEELDRAFSHLFSRTFLCRGLDNAVDFAKRYKLNGVTLNGEQVFVRGDMAGGYRRTNSTIAAHKIRCTVLKKIKKIEDQLKKIDNDLKILEENVAKNSSEITKCAVKLQKNGDVEKRIGEEIKSHEKHLKYLEIKLVEKEKILNEFVTNLEIRCSTKEALERELEQDLGSQLSEEDQDKLTQINDKITDLKSKKYKLAKKLEDLGDTKYHLEKLLKRDLLQKEKLEPELLKLKEADEKNNAELQLTREEIDKTKTKLERINELIDNEEVKKLLADKDKLDEKVKELKEKRQKKSKRFNDLSSKLDELKLKLRGYMEKISGYKEMMEKLGPIERNNNNRLSFSDLNDRLRELTAYLKEFKAINPYSQNQFDLMLERTNRLIDRKRKLLQYGEEISQFIEMIRQRKADTIYHTFQCMNSYFDKYFKQLVPEGSVKFTLKLNKNETKNFEDITPELIDSGRIIGVGLEIVFDEATGTQTNMKRFSSGQKSLVAMAFIFAAQECHPTPFFILDECDYALDPEYREMLAKLIEEFSGKTQIISTTFRPEQLEYATEFFGVKIQNRVSNLLKTTKEAAVDFIEN